MKQQVSTDEDRFNETLKRMLMTPPEPKIGKKEEVGNQSLGRPVSEDENKKD